MVEISNLVAWAILFQAGSAIIIAFYSILAHQMAKSTREVSTVAAQAVHTLAETEQTRFFINYFLFLMESAGKLTELAWTHDRLDVVQMLDEAAGAVILADIAADQDTLDTKIIPMIGNLAHAIDKAGKALYRQERANQINLATRREEPM